MRYIGVYTNLYQDDSKVTFFCLNWNSKNLKSYQKSEIAKYEELILRYEAKFSQFKQLQLILHILEACTTSW